MSAQRRAFTLLEIMFALALSGVVIIAAMSLFWMVQSSDRRLAEQFDDQIQFAETQRILRHAIVSLVAAPPETPPPQANTGLPTEGGGEDELESALELARQAERERFAALISDLGGDENLISSLLGNDGSGYANFELFHELSPSGRPLPRLALTLMRPPVSPPFEFDNPFPVAIAGDKVSGSFDLIEEGDTLTLVWQPLDPPGVPTILVRNLIWAEWWILPRRRHGLEWVDVYAAYIEERYPVAVRLAMWTTAGSHVDWLFETAVTTPNQ